MFINYQFSKTLIFTNNCYKEKEQENFDEMSIKMRCPLKVELDFEKKSIFKCCPLAVLPLISPIFHFDYFRGEESFKKWILL